MKYRSSKRAKALAISPEVKEKVWWRDSRRCIICGRYGDFVFPDAHFIPRSKGGLGIEQNIVTLCRECHDQFDHGDRITREYLKAKIRDYLQCCYPDWDYGNEDKLKYYKELSK